MTKSKKPIFKLTNCPYYLITRASLSITSVLKKAFSAAGLKKLKPAYLGVLMTLAQEDSLKMIDLGRKINLEPSSMTGLLDRMERDDLVQRIVDPHDRRVQRIILTSYGRSILSDIVEIVFKLLDSVFDGIPKEDVETAKSVLRKVLSNIKKVKYEERK
ncbi:MarR family transcriptional regulator [Candidatus Magnetomorum sp. HK-1]|nr:MarR family transcriptional regulator [Candidatus Magnetomorum sp. HK-1]